jgi:hypothetical protein
MRSTRCNAERRIGALVLACGLGIARAHGQTAAVAIPLDVEWQAESANAAEPATAFRERCRDPRLGVRALSAVVVDRGRLSVDADLRPRTRDYQIGELSRDVRDLRDAGIPPEARTQPWGLDLTGATIRIALELPDIREAMVQLFVETENGDGIRARYYGKATDIMRPGRSVVEFAPDPVATGACTTYRDVWVDITKVARVGLKIGLDRNAAAGFRGTLGLVEAGIRWSAADRVSAIARQKTAQQKRREPTDAALWRRLPPLPSLAGARRVPISAATLTGGAPNVVVGETLVSPIAGTRVVDIRFSSYRPDAAARSAQLVINPEQPLDLRDRVVSAFVAIGRTLRGVVTRPNQVQLELWDVDGRVWRGPAEGVSGSLLFTDAGVAESATWVRVEAAPFAANLPQTMGHRTPGFRPDLVTRIGLRFELGKNSHLLNGSTTAGALLVSDLMISDTPATGALALAPRPRAAARPTVRAAAVSGPLPLVGINYAFFEFGSDVGRSAYPGYDGSRGFSANRHRLVREFDLFCRKGVDLVRVFLLGDLRTGVTYDSAGMVSGLDEFALADLRALLDAATTRVALMPVLIDFLIADRAHESRLLDRTVRVGEAPQVIVDPAHRRAFIEHALRPIVRALADAERRRPGAIYAIDVGNELENAKAIFTPALVPAVVEFVELVAEMIREEAPTIPVTLGSRDRDALVEVWSGSSVDLPQFHVYDKMAEEESRPFDYPAARLGFAAPVIIGEIEPTNVADKLDAIARNGYAAALFWSWRGLDGYVVDLDELQRWKARRRESLGLEVSIPACGGASPAP